MGSSLRFNYFLIILWINVCSLNCLIDTNNTNCSHNCEYQITGSEGLNKTCTITNNACDELQTPTWSQMATVAEAIPRLASIEIYSDMQNHMFNLSFLVPQSFQNKTDTFQLQFKDFSDSGEICQTIQFLETFSSETDIFTYDCYSDVQSNKTYVMTLKNPQYDDITVSYLIFTPQVINQSANQEEWETVIGVLISPTVGNDGVFDIAVMFQPAIYSVKSYLVEMKLNHVHRSRYLFENQTSVIFRNMYLAIEDLLQITVRPEGCNGSCKETTTANFSRFETTSIPTTAAATTESRTSSTITTKATSTTTTTTVGPETKGSTANITTTPDPSVIMKPANQEDYKRKIEIIVGTVAGVAVLVAIAIVTFCVCRKRRQFFEGGFQMERFGNNRDSGSSLGTNAGFKQQPSVLVLYSYDCAPHEKVVTSFSNYLQNVMNCDVIIDLWEKLQIQQLNSEYQWLQTRFQTCQFVIVICSAGARYKCMRHKKFRMKSANKTSPDTFQWAVDFTGELMRTTKKSGESLAKFITVYFDYASKSDIPPKLDHANSFSMMKDVFQLYCHLHWIQKDSLDSNDNLQHQNKSDIQFESFHKNEHGKKLQEALDHAVKYFKENPDWIANTLEPVNPIHSVVQNDATNKVKKKGEQQELDSKQKPKDHLLEERRKKRNQDKDKDIDKIPLNKTVPHLDLDAVVHAPGHSRVPSNSSTSSQVPLVGNGNTRSIPKFSPKFTTSASHKADKISLVNKEEEEDAIDEDAQLQKDLEFITNFDKIKQNEAKQKDDIHLDFHGFTPPDDFLYLAGLEENSTYTHLQRNGIPPENQYASLQRNGHYVIDFPQSNEDKIQILNGDIDLTTGTKEIKL